MGLDLGPSTPNYCFALKFWLQILRMIVFVNWSSFKSKWLTIQLIYSKMYSGVSTNNHDGTTTFLVDDMI